MSTCHGSKKTFVAWGGALLLVLSAAQALAVQPKAPTAPLDELEFSQPELYLSSSSVPLEEVLPRLANRAAWGSFLSSAIAEVPIPVCPVCDVDVSRAFIDPRSGAARNIIVAWPLLPGTGAGNRLTPADLGASEVTPEVVSRVARGFIETHRAVLGVDTAQLGAVRAVAVTPELWQISVPQVYAGIPVRHGRLAASIKHGNLVVIGTETWGNVAGLDAQPRLEAKDALGIGFDRVGGRRVADVIERQPRLEIVPVAPPEAQDGDAFTGRVGRGYAHRLVWSFVFRRPPAESRWEVLVDAHDGEVLALQDTNHYVKRSVVGGVYPLTSTEICPDSARCGNMRAGWPMPFADTGFGCANSAGVYDYTSGTATTTLSGCYVDLNTDYCGALSLSSTNGNLNLLGANGQHDCTTPGVGGAGNTAAARTSYYEANKIHEIARGYLPGNAWLQGTAGLLRLNTNINSSCNAYYTGNSINFYKALGGCRNTGEIQAVIDHEWGHALDDFDANGVLSNSSEGYADIAAVYRSQSSCVGYGFFWNYPSIGCGQTSDGTGYNCKEGPWCCSDCSGVRDADYARYVGAPPFTPQNFVCPYCGSGSGPCGKQVHCAAAPSRQAGWDLAARDLQSPPFSFDSQTAFIVANKLFYQGSGNVGAWHNCSCAAGTSDGCGATNAYMQWLTADDDNGNLADGTPHMTAIYNAFNRHNIACQSPCPNNCGCFNGPTAAPTLTATRGVYQVSLSWTAVTNAQRYWVFRTEGHAGCNFGKALIAEVTGTSYVDTEVLPCRTYSYNVVAAGASSSCYGRASNCASATPTTSPLTLCAIEEEDLD
jgi:hypothetical protein